MFDRTTLLITGTFGNAVLRRYLQSDIAEIRIFSRDEKKQDDMRRRWADHTQARKRDHPPLHAKKH